MEEQLQEIEAKIPLKEAIKLLCPSKTFLRERVLKRIKDQEEIAARNHECKVSMEKEVILQEKLDDRGTFTLPCSLGQTVFRDSLCNLGASVSVMPLTVVKRLGLKDYKPSKLSLILADRTIRRPYGMLENLPVRIGHVEVPTDFIMLEMDEEPRNPLILGIPFLASDGAVIDVKMGKIKLKLGKDLVMKFDIEKDPRKLTINGQLFAIEKNHQEADEFLEEFPSYIPLSIVVEPPNSPTDSSEWVNHMDYQSKDEEAYLEQQALEAQIEAPTRKRVKDEDEVSDAESRVQKSGSNRRSVRRTRSHHSTLSF
ncbi:hypothetical protein V5N11_019474 [Cardamine amara subsp. amara]|uniref:Aspartic peptidase DDI1-type domain-containing protein n=1 Tax=Cardamine amara subsp. amara TaxID=228776 RepID=A0ABD1ACJ9_CARAN